jgi:hypothetical protein
MNDIYWHDKQTMPSKQLSSPPPTQPRRSYENTLQTKQYQQTDIRLNSHSRTGRTVTSAYPQYPPAPNRSHNHNGNFSYVSSLHGVYRQSPPTVMTSPSPIHPNRNRYVDLRNQSHPSQQRQLTRSVSEDYYTTKYQEFNGFNDEIYHDDEENEENCSEIFNYTFDETGVSLHKKKYRESQDIYQNNIICHLSLFIFYPFN